jgi:RHS repeat-associated protein
MYAYGFTGQREEADIGLYYYVARWYDPVIGHFIQADSIIPNPASAKAFDRYAYVANNPIIYTDPSGHMYLEESYSSPSIVCIDGECKEGPDLLFSYNLSHTQRGGTGKTGVEYYDWYIQLWFTDGWHQDTFGGDGNFTIEEAMTIGMIGESANQYIGNEFIVEAEVREYYEWCKAMTVPCNSKEQIINFFAGHYESAARQMGRGTDPDDVYANDKNVSAAFNLVTNFANPTDPNWTTGREWNRPYGSANVSYIMGKKPYGYDFSKAWIEIIRTNPSVNKMFFHITNGWYIASGCVERMMDNHINPSAWSCPQVRP